jgi:hypothetical protein
LWYARNLCNVRKSTLESRVREPMIHPTSSPSLPCTGAGGRGMGLPRLHAAPACPIFRSHKSRPDMPLVLWPRYALVGQRGPAGSSLRGRLSKVHITSFAAHVHHMVEAVRIHNQSWRRAALQSGMVAEAMPHHGERLRGHSAGETCLVKVSTAAHHDVINVSNCPLQRFSTHTRRSSGCIRRFYL